MVPHALITRHMRALHIVGWYPNAEDPTQAPFVHRHVEAMRRFSEQEVWHIEVRAHARWGWRSKGPSADRTLMLLCPLKTWFVIEWITTLMVLWAWITRDRSKSYDVVNFYIAYPLCTHMGLLRWFIRRPMLMMEQWSGYHFELGTSGAGLGRVRRIFRFRIPVICVSESLAFDIRRFSGIADHPYAVVPNVVEVGSFAPGKPPEPGQRTVFFAVANWRRPKRPEIMVEAIAMLRDRGRNVHLRIGGDGPEMKAVMTRVEQLGLQDRVERIGWLTSAEAGTHMRNAAALMHCSDYETFSVVCAEALCCGTPVIASRVGGIPSFVNEGNGLLIDTNTAEAWAEAIDKNWDRIMSIDRPAISAQARARFAPDTVGRQLNTLFERRMKGLPVDNA